LIPVYGLYCQLAIASAAAAAQQRRAIEWLSSGLGPLNVCAGRSMAAALACASAGTS
jgi:hypothetical protein